MNSTDMQQEELEVLESIYAGDDCFKQINNTTFQYKCGENGSPKSMLLEISWGETYPEEKPIINLNTFYNNHLDKQCKDFLCQQISEKAEEMLGCAMTYTLFEWAKENMETLLADQQISVANTTLPMINEPEEVKNERSKDEKRSESKKKKEQLTKNQKKKLFDRVGNRGEVARGANWVDVIKHLSQTGSKLETG